MKDLDVQYQYLAPHEKQHYRNKVRLIISQRFKQLSKKRKEYEEMRIKFFNLEYKSSLTDEDQGN